MQGPATCSELIPLPMRQVIGVEGQIDWLYFQDAKSQNWIGVCPPLKLTVEGDTLPELNETMTEAMDLFFNEMLSTGDLDRFLKENGWRLNAPAPERRRQQQVMFDVPLHTQRIAERDLDKVCC